MGPVHGAWCNAKTWPTKCPGCNSDVFFFHCDCGSKVFFDSLGDPWPIHDCATSWTKNLVRYKDGGGGITVQIRDGITVRRPPEDFAVEGTIISRARGLKQKNWVSPIVSVKPDGAHGNITIIGVVREKDGGADIFRSLNLRAESPLVMASLKELGAGRNWRITVHEPSSSENVQHSYTIWVPSLIVDKRCTIGMTVEVGISPLSVLGHAPIWRCHYIEVYG